jgi:non-specific serine/threonine protein kinase
MPIPWSVRPTSEQFKMDVHGEADSDSMPPEVLRGKTYTFSADYWSLGCILFEFLCVSRPRPKGGSQAHLIGLPAVLWVDARRNMGQLEELAQGPSTARL